MDRSTLIWIIVGIVVLLVVVAAALLLTARGRRERRMEHQHDRAEKLRADARETQLQAREHEAEAARARADSAAATAAAESAKARAAEASIDAERRAATIDDHRAEAESLRERQAETLRKADDVDPYVDADAGEQAPMRRSASTDPREADAPRVAVGDGMTADGRPVADERARQDRDEVAPPTRADRG